MGIPTKAEYAKQQEELARQQAMDKEHTVAFTKRELSIIYNIILFDYKEDGSKFARKYSVGDAVFLSPILDKIQPIIAVDTNIPVEDQGKQDSNGIIQKKAES